MAWTPSSQVWQWTFSAAAVTSARSSEPRRSASSSTRSVVPAGASDAIGRMTTDTIPVESRSFAWSPRCIGGRSPGLGRVVRRTASTGLSGETTRMPSREASHATW